MDYGIEWSLDQGFPNQWVATPTGVLSLFEQRLGSIRG